MRYLGHFYEEGLILRWNLWPLFGRMDSLDGYETVFRIWKFGFAFRRNRPLP